MSPTRRVVSGADIGRRALDRRTCGALTLCLLAVGPALLATAPDAAPLLRQVRDALGGDPVLSGTSSFLITGTKILQTAVVHETVPFEIACTLPDRFVWKDASGQGDIVLGFAGKRLITNAPQASQLATQTTVQGRGAVIRDDQQLLTARARFAVVTLPLLAASFRGAPLHFALMPPTTTLAPVSVTGDDGFAATLVINSATHLPDRLAYRLPSTDAAGGLLTVEWQYVNYRDEEGRKVPSAIALGTTSSPTGANLKIFTTYRIDEIRFNVEIDPKKFTGYGLGHRP